MASPQPTVSFSSTSIALTEGTQTTDGNPVSIMNLARMTAKMTDPTGMSKLMNTIQFTTSPKGAAVESCVDVDGKDDDVIALTFGTQATVATYYQSD